MNMKKVIGNITFIAVLLIIIARFATIFNGSPFPLNVVVSSSMNPSLQRGDIVPWIPCKVGDAKIGDVVVYKSIYGNMIIHRVVEIKNGKLITRGDANNYTDQSGPHIPELPIGEKQFYGKAVMIGKQPLKIPFAGYAWIFLKNAISHMSQPIKWGRPQPAIHYIIFLPFTIFFALLISLIIMWLPNGKNLKEKLHELIFGPEKLSLKTIIAYSFSIFIPFLLLSSFFAYDSINVGNETKIDKIPVINPSLFPVKGIVFFEGNGSSKISNKIFMLGRGERMKINASFNKNSEGKLFIYSSPFWIIFPEKFMHYIYNFNPRLCILSSSIFSAIILSSITVILLLISSFIIEKYFLSSAYLSFLSLKYHSFLTGLYKISEKIRRGGKKIENKLKDATLWIDNMNKNALLISITSFIFLPFLFDGIKNLFLFSFISSIILSALAYLFSCRFKNEFAFISLFSSLSFSSIFVGKMIFSMHGDELILLLQFFSITFIVLLILFIFNFSIMLLTAYLLHFIREKSDPAAMLEVCDI